MKKTTLKNGSHRFTLTESELNALVDKAAKLSSCLSNYTNELVCDDFDTSDVNMLNHVICFLREISENLSDPTVVYNLPDKFF